MWQSLTNFLIQSTDQQVQINRGQRLLEEVCPARLWEHRRSGSSGRSSWLRLSEAS